jgi:hypothetical protein
MTKISETSRQMGRFKQIERQIAQVFNRHSVDNDFGIPDFILARLVMRHLQALMQLNRELILARASASVWRTGSIQDNEELNARLEAAEGGE